MGHCLKNHKSKKHQFKKLSLGPYLLGLPKIDAATLQNQKIVIIQYVIQQMVPQEKISAATHGCS